MSGKLHLQAFCRPGRPLHCVNVPSPATTSAAAASPVSDKLKNLLKQAETVQQQADSAVKTGRRDRLSAMSSQITTILDNVSALVGGLTGSGAPQAGASTSLADNQTAISSVLGTVNATLSELSILLPDAIAPSPERTTIGQLASQTASLARQAGVSLQKTTVGEVASAMTSHSPHLIDLLV